MKRGLKCDKTWGTKRHIREHNPTDTVPPAIDQDSRVDPPTPVNLSLDLPIFDIAFNLMSLDSVVASTMALAGLEQVKLP